MDETYEALKRRRAEEIPIRSRSAVVRGLIVEALEMKPAGALEAATRSTEPATGELTDGT